MILLFGPAADEPLEAVRAALSRRRAPVFFMDQCRLKPTCIEFSVGSAVTGVLRAGSQELALGRVSAAYLRPYEFHQLPGVQAAGRKSVSARNLAFSAKQAISGWSDVTPATVINRASAETLCNSKPYQSALIRSLGFAIPDTLITTDPRTALQFWRRHRKVVYKSLSSVRSVVSCLTPAHRNRLANVRWCPTHFQQLVLGTDYRVHIIGDDIFGCEVITKAVDYRYPGPRGPWALSRPVKLPADVAERCWRLASGFKLLVAGIDLRRTPGGRWYCFEINPSPVFTYYYVDEAARVLADSIAGLLHETPRRARH